MFAHVCRRSGFDPRNGQARLWLPSLRGTQHEEQLVCRWVTTTEYCERKSCGREIGHVWLMQPEAQTTNVCFLAVIARASLRYVSIRRRLRSALLYLHLHFGWGLKFLYSHWVTSKLVLCRAAIGAFSFRNCQL